MIEKSDYGYYVDLVICVGAMRGCKHFLENLKRRVSSLFEDLGKAMEEEDREVGQFRVKIIAFRGYGNDGVEPMTVSRFFSLPEESEQLYGFLDSVEIYGGQLESNALEAISLALKSDWTTGGVFRRHIVTVATSAPVCPLGEKKESEGYPEEMPRDLNELQRLWEGERKCDNSTFSPAAARLIAFVPYESPWVEMQDFCKYWPAFAGPGSWSDPDDVSMDEFIQFVAGVS